MDGPVNNSLQFYPGTVTFAGGTCKPIWRWWQLPRRLLWIMFQRWVGPTAYARKVLSMLCQWEVRLKPTEHPISEGEQ